MWTDDIAALEHEDVGGEKYEETAEEAEHEAENVPAQPQGGLQKDLVRYLRSPDRRPRAWSLRCSILPLRSPPTAQATLSGTFGCVARSCAN